MSPQGRRKKGYFIVEGFKLFREALLSGVAIESLFYSPGSFYASVSDRKLLENTLKDSNIQTYLISESIMASLCDTVTPQGILSVLSGEVPYYSKEIDFFNEIWLLAFEVQDPGNLGTIIRTADAAGVAGIFLSPGSADVTNPKVLRATMGSFFHMKLFKLKDTESFILTSKKKGVIFISTSISCGSDYFQMQYSYPLVLIIGNESHGLTDKIISLSDFTVTIPIYGRAESLNVGVASGIILYEIVRQKRNVPFRF
ncbi:MAG: putative TrmH family tRNA/rRNA methyltransferase [bacterium ADurb.Bin363]|nr:MAG: putative TrmH family tRNA/rRNA methyltransferase [bacterium ADurb.Bin363]